MMVQWQPVKTEEQTEGEYLQVLQQAPPFGLTRGLRQLGLRKERGSTKTVQRVWMIEGLPA
eukprot:1951755-Amphidinium_carterae.1